jgi:Peptidase family M28
MRNSAQGNPSDDPIVSLIKMPGDAASIMIDPVRGDMSIRSPLFKTLSLALLAAFFVACAGEPRIAVTAHAPNVGAATSRGSPGAPDALPSFSRARAMGHVKALARRIGVRVRATRPERRGARYIAGKLRGFGYNVRVQRFEVDGGTSRNVIASWPGSMRYPFIVGAHMDSVPRSPGANDNASGVAVMIEIARLVKDRSQAEFVKFVAFGAEEYGTDGRHHVGSQVFVNRLGSRGRQMLPGMVSVDMIADGRPLIDGTAGIGPRVVARTFLRKMRAAEINAVYRTTCDCSDNGPFERAGIPAAFLWSGDEPNYHLPSDTPRNLRPDDLFRTGRGVRAFVRDLDRDLIARLRRH